MLWDNDIIFCRLCQANSPKLSHLMPPKNPVKQGGEILLTPFDWLMSKLRLREIRSIAPDLLDRKWAPALCLNTALFQWCPHPYGQGGYVWVDGEGEGAQRKIRKREERSGFLWPLASLIFLWRWRIRCSREAGPANLWGGKQLKALSSSFSSFPPLLPFSGEDSPRSGEGRPSSPRPGVWESHAGSPQREPNAHSRVWPVGL